MSNLRNIISYILSHHQGQDDILIQRLIDLVYLSDWLSAIENEKQLTNISWFYDNYGPSNSALRNKIMECFTVVDENGSRKVKIPQVYESMISCPEKIIIDKIIRLTKNKSYDDFRRYVISTYPLVASNQYSDLNLVELAKQYKVEKEKLNANV